MKKQVFKKKAGQALTLAISAALLTQAAQAASLGSIVTYSYLNEPLSVVVMVDHLDIAELEGLTAQVMSAEDYAKAGLRRPAWVDFAKVHIKSLGNGRYGVEVTSSVPVNDPASSLLLEIKNKGTLLQASREYALLLDMKADAIKDPLKVDPVGSSAISEKEFNRRASEPTTEQIQAAAQKALAKKAAEEEARAAKANKGKNGGKKTNSATPKALDEKAPGAKTPEKSNAGSSASSGSDEVSVSKGNVLSSIAAAKALDGVSQEQLMLGFLKQNPNAFIDQNINRMKAGVILRVPTKEEALKVEASEARAQVATMTQSFKAWRQSAAAASLPVKDASQGVGSSESTSNTTSATSGVITKEVGAGKKDELKLSQAEAKADVSKNEAKGKGATATKTTGAAGATGVKAEDTIAKQKELSEAKSRQAELESTSQNLKKLLDLRNEQLASVGEKGAENRASREKEEALKEKHAQAQTATEAEAAARAAAASAKEKAEGKVEGKATDAAVSAESAAKSAGATGAEASAGVGTHADGKSSDATGSTEKEAKPHKVLPPKKVIPPPAEPEPSFMDQFGQEAYLGGGLVAALLAAGALVYQRRKKKKEGPITITPDTVTLAEESASFYQEPLMLDEKPAQSYDEALQEADTFIAFKQHQKALVALDEALSFRPSDIEALIRKAQIFAEHQQKEELENTLNVLRQHPEADRYQDLLAQLEMQLRKSGSLEDVSRGLESMMDKTADHKKLAGGLAGDEEPSPWQSLEKDQFKSWAAPVDDSSDLNDLEELKPLSQEDTSSSYRSSEGLNTDFMASQALDHHIVDHLPRLPESSAETSNSVSLELDQPVQESPYSKVSDLSPIDPIPGFSDEPLEFPQFESHSVNMDLPDDRLNQNQNEVPAQNAPMDFTVNMDQAAAEATDDGSNSSVANTMFDLAKAYEEMNDFAGAREMLLEVVQLKAGSISEEAKKRLEALPLN